MKLLNLLGGSGPIVKLSIPSAGRQPMKPLPARDELFTLLSFQYPLRVVSQ